MREKPLWKKVADEEDKWIQKELRKGKDDWRIYID